MQEYLWPDEKVLVKGYQLEMMFKVEDDRETDWYRGTVTKIIKRDEKQVRAEIKWNKRDIMVGESTKTVEILKKHLWNVSNQKAEDGDKICHTWRENLTDGQFSYVINN